MKRNINLFIILAAVAVSIVSCSTDKETTPVAKTINIILNGEDSVSSVKGLTVINFASCVADSLKAGNRYSKIDSVYQYGLGIYYPLPDSLIGKKLELKIKAKVLGTESQNGVFVASLEKNQPTKTSLYYGSIDYGLQMNGKVKQWIDVAGDLVIEADNNIENGAVLVVYPWMALGKGQTWIDDLNISIVVTESTEEE
ncbi:MAG: hypothetical protein QM534_05975 [Sediminibacterium sp.]|nr:hypothetical protein [Sediminibacterium sp.]